MSTHLRLLARDDRSEQWELLPFRFDRFDETSVLLTNLVGEHEFVTPEQLSALMGRSLDDSEVLRRLEASHIIRRRGDQLPIELLAMKLRTRSRRLSLSTGLHIFVVTLRCEHSCRYCQVSRKAASNEEFDMSEDHAVLGLKMAFRSPNPSIKIELQGGEPLLNFPMVRFIVEMAEQMNLAYQKNLAFVIATNLALVDDEVLAYCREHRVAISTSLDGPEDLHNRNRPRPNRDSWQRVRDGIEIAQQELGHDQVSVLMTTTEASLDRAEDIVGTYKDLGLHEIFLRPLSPFGFARRASVGGAYDADRWLDFYRRSLNEVLRLNRDGYPMIEHYTALIAKKMLTNEDPGYVDLTSPAGIGIGALVYNYDGEIYASDEGRMLAETGDKTFCLGHLGESDYDDVMLSDKLLAPLEDSFAMSTPMCTDCAYQPYCGSDPVYHHATQGNPVGNKIFSGFCRRNMGAFKIVLDLWREDAHARDVLWRWAHS